MDFKKLGFEFYKKKKLVKRGNNKIGLKKIIN